MKKQATEGPEIVPAPPTGSRPCSVAECKEPHYRRGYCTAHGYRFKRYGDPLAVLTHGRRVNTGVLGEFEKHLLATQNRQSADQYLTMVKRFLRFIGGESQLKRITDDTMKEFFKEITGKRMRRKIAVAVGQFLRFNAGDKLPAKSGELARLEQGWQRQKLQQKRESRDDMLALLGRKLVNHYLYFQTRLQGGPETIEDLSRVAAECAELIQTHLPLFLSLSAEGRNVHTIIDERVKT